MPFTPLAGDPCLCSRVLGAASADLQVVGNFPRQDQVAALAARQHPIVLSRFELHSLSPEEAADYPPLSRGRMRRRACLQNRSSLFPFRLNQP